MASSLSVKTESSSTKSYQCDKCSYSATFKSTLNNHYVIHSTDRPCRCRSCEYRSKWKASVKVHEKRHRSGRKRRNYCTFPGCSYRSNTSRWVKHHERNVHHFIRSKSSQQIKCKPAAFHCKDCGYMNKNKQQLTSHMRCHSDERPFPCTFPGCAYRAKFSNKAREHERNVHHFIRSHSSKKSKREAQQRTTPEASRKSARVQVAKLIRKSRTTETPTTLSTENFQTEAETPIEIAPSSLSVNTGSSSTKPYHCDKCTYSGASKRLLNSHYAVHSADRTFGCHYCQYRAKQKRSVLIHEKRHHSGKPSRLKGLRRPFPCAFPGCSYRSNTPGGAHVHESMIHKFTRSRSSRQIKWKAQEKSAHQAPNKLKAFKAQVSKAVQISPTRKISTRSSTEKVQCPQCDLNVYRHFLQNHLEVNCGGEKLFGCSVKGCNYRTKWLKQLNSHKTRCGKVSKELLSSARKKPLVVVQPEVGIELHVVNDDNDNEMEQENYIEISMEPTTEVLVDSTGFACTLCDFVGYSEMAALNHANCHTQPFFPTAKLNEIPIICLD